MGRKKCNKCGRIPGYRVQCPGCHRLVGRCCTDYSRDPNKTDICIDCWLYGPAQHKKTSCGTGPYWCTRDSQKINTSSDLSATDMCSENDQQGSSSKVTNVCGDFATDDVGLSERQKDLDRHWPTLGSGSSSIGSKHTLCNESDKAEHMNGGSIQKPNGPEEPMHLKWWTNRANLPIHTTRSSTYHPAGHESHVSSWNHKNDGIYPQRFATGRKPRTRKTGNALNAGNEKGTYHRKTHP